MSLTVIAFLGFASCQPDIVADPTDRRSYEQMRVLQPLENDVGVKAPRNSRVLLSHEAPFLLDDSDFGPPVFTVVLKDESGASLPFDRNGRWVLPSSLLPANSMIVVEIEPTDDHPCPECVEALRTYSFETSDVVDVIPPVLATAPRLQAESFAGDPFAMCAVIPPNVGLSSEIAIPQDEFLLMKMMSGTETVSAATPMSPLSVHWSSANLSTSFRDPMPPPGTHLGVVFVVEDIAGNHATSFPARVEVLGQRKDVDDENTDREDLSADVSPVCFLSAPSHLDAATTIPNNGVVRVRSLLSPFALAMESVVDVTNASTLLPLASVFRDNELETWRVPQGVAGSVTIKALPCDNCLCESCAPPSTSITVRADDDVTRPESPQIDSFRRRFVAAPDADETCRVWGDVLDVVIVAAADDNTALEDLRYDVLGGDVDEPLRVLDRAVAAEIVDGETIVTARLPRDLVLSHDASRLVVGVVARDLADNESERALSNEERVAGGCACVDAKPPSRMGAFIGVLVAFLFTRRRGTSSIGASAA